MRSARTGGIGDGKIFVLIYRSRETNSHRGDRTRLCEPRSGIFTPRRSLYQPCRPFRPMDRRFAVLACGSDRRGIGDAVLRRSVPASASPRPWLAARRSHPACDPKTLTGMCAQFWRYSLDAHLDGVDLDDNSSLEKQGGPQKERRRHGDDELRHYLSRVGCSRS